LTARIGEVYNEKVEIVLKASKDIIAHLTKTDRLKSFTEYFPLKDKTKALKNILSGSAIAPIVFFIDRFLINN